jgi:hypothetical protein
MTSPTHDHAPERSRGLRFGRHPRRQQSGLLSCSSPDTRLKPEGPWTCPGQAQDFPCEGYVSIMMREHDVVTLPVFWRRVGLVVLAGIASAMLIPRPSGLLGMSIGQDRRF